MDKQYDLQFYQNRSTPQVLLRDESPRPKKNYGKATSRRPASSSELKTINQGKWVRVDESGNTPRKTEYKKTEYRPWLVSKSAFGVEHASISKLSNGGFKRDGKLSRKEAVAGGAVGTAGVGTGVAVAPIKMDMPEPEGEVKISGDRADLKSLRRVATHEGKRFGNEAHIAQIAQNMRDNPKTPGNLESGFDTKHPIEVERTRDGKHRVVGGHHRLAAAEKLGMKDAPIQITESKGSRPQVGTSLIGRRRKKRDIKRGRQAAAKMTNAEIDAAASKKTHPILQKINEFHAAKGNFENSFNSKVKPKMLKAAKNPKVIGGAAVASGGAIAGGKYAHDKKSGQKA